MFICIFIKQHFTKILNDGASEYGESLFSGSLISLREMADRGIKLPDLDRTALDLHTPERRNANTRVNFLMRKFIPSNITHPIYFLYFFCSLLHRFSHLRSTTMKSSEASPAQLPICISFHTNLVQDCRTMQECM